MKIPEPVRKKPPTPDQKVERAARAVLENPARYGGEEALIVKVSRATIARLEKEKK